MGPGPCVAILRRGCGSATCSVCLLLIFASILGTIPKIRLSQSGPARPLACGFTARIGLGSNSRLPLPLILSLLKGVNKYIKVMIRSASAGFHDQLCANERRALPSRWCCFHAHTGSSRLHWVLFPRPYWITAKRPTLRASLMRRAWKACRKFILVLPNSPSESVSVFFPLQMAVAENACQDQDHKRSRAEKRRWGSMPDPLPSVQPGTLSSLVKHKFFHLRDRTAPSARPSPCDRLASQAQAPAPGSASPRSCRADGHGGRSAGLSAGGPAPETLPSPLASFSTQMWALPERAASEKTTPTRGLNCRVSELSLPHRVIAAGCPTENCSAALLGCFLKAGNNRLFWHGDSDKIIIIIITK